MSFKDVADYAQAEALANKLAPTDEAVWHSYCRKYSQTFYTPLHEVLKMDPAVVMLHVHEDQLSDVSVEDNMEIIMDMIYTIDDPEYAKQKRDELKDFIKEAEEEEEQRQETGKPIHKALAEENSVSLKNTSKTPQGVQKQNLPQGGGVNLSYLEREEAENDGDDF